MSRQTFFFVLLLIGIQCFLSATQEYNAEWKNFRTNNNRPELGNFPNIPRHPIRHNETNWEKLAADAEIEHILFGENMNFQKCLDARLKRNPCKAEKKYTIARTTPDKAPWTVVILREEIYKNKTLKNQECVGSLIHPQVVLTAAHCVFNKTLSSLKARIGECDRIHDKPCVSYQQRTIKEAVLKNTYSIEKPKADIALLFLEGSFELSDHTKTICLPSSSLNLNYTQCLVSGWEPNPDGVILAGYEVFKMLNITILPRDKCEIVLQMTGLNQTFTLERNSICAGGQSNKTMLQGNGGAPLACRLCGINCEAVQVGIMSWGFNEPLLPEIFTATSSFYDWIKEEFEKRKIDFSNCGFQWKD